MDVTSLVFGLIFTALAAMWPVRYFDLLPAGALAVLVPVTLVVVGVTGVVASLARARRHRVVEPMPDVAALEEELGMRLPDERL
jgi:hypothetical protein